MGIDPNGVYHGKFQDIIPYITEKVQLCFTSPPYEDAINYWDYGKKVSGGITGQRYVDEYFIRLFDSLYDVLADDGIVGIVVNDITKRRAKSNAIYRGVCEVCNRGWHRIDTVIWLKPQTLPRPRTQISDTFEYIFLFARTLDYKIYPERIRRPYSELTAERYRYSLIPIEKTKSRVISRGQQPPAERKKVAIDPYGAGMANVIYSPVSNDRSDHPAKFPVRLAQWAITLYTDKGDIVLDPMCGSGTTLAAAKEMGRRYIGIDISKEYADMSRKRLEGVFHQEELFDETLNPDRKPETNHEQLELI